MKYWYGYRVYDEKIDRAPCKKVLEGPYESYNSAKEARIKTYAPDMLSTGVFQAPNREEAQKHLGVENFTRF